MHVCSQIHIPVKIFLFGGSVKVSVCCKKKSMYVCIYCLMAEQYDTKSNVKLGMFQSQLEGVLRV